jgi:hypothetical protein
MRPGRHTKTCIFSLIVAIGLATSAAKADPVLDGSGFSATPTSVVTYDPSAPDSNFGTPTSTTKYAPYDIFTKSDATYLYVMVSETTGGAAAAGSFANLYFGTGVSATSGSDVGFEVSNSDVFVPGGSGTTSTAGTGISFASLDGGTVIEFAVPFTYFELDPQNIGFDKVTATDPDIILRLSQSFGYSVAGGADYGTDRLGLFVDPNVAAVPEPVSALLFGTGFVGFAWARCTRARRALA